MGMRVGALRICLALMLALLVVPGYIVAPALFAGAGSQALAGELAGTIFHISLLSLLFLAASVAAFWLRMEAGRSRWVLLLLLSLLVAINAFALAPIMAELKVQMGPIDLVAKEDPQRQLFGLYHGISAILHLLSSFIAIALVAIGPVRKGENGDACHTL
ncbi:MAG: DUF4149 domain-containing protein [Mariprofundus sp.]|nr:DUF4149 domain-containing protein [Mariprofundus sp.]